MNVWLHSGLPFASKRSAVREHAHTHINACVEASQGGEHAGDCQAKSANCRPWQVHGKIRCHLVLATSCFAFFVTTFRRANGCKDKHIGWWMEIWSNCRMPQILQLFSASKQKLTFLSHQLVGTVAERMGLLSPGPWLWLLASA